MPDTVTTPEITITPAAPAPEAPPAENFSLEYVQQLRGEAAKYRTEKKDAVEAAEAKAKTEWEAKINEQIGKNTELEGKLGAAGIELTKLRVALALNVPSDKVLAFVEILKGSTEDEITSSAASAKELFGGFKTTDPATDPTQGSGGGALPLNGDPLLNALKKVVGA